LERHPNSICGPGQDSNIAVHVVPRLDELAAIRAGQKAIFFSGIVQYEDAFDQQRYFIFRCRMTGQPVNITLKNGTSQFGWALGPDQLGYKAN
jgi:hypothetical protein